MKRMPKRDITGKCGFGCRDRVLEGQVERQLEIDPEPYDSPIEHSPSWTLHRNEQPGVFGGHV